MFQINHTIQTRENDTNEKWTIGSRTLIKKTRDSAITWCIEGDWNSMVSIDNNDKGFGETLVIGYNWKTCGTQTPEETAEFATELQNAMVVGQMFQAIYELNK